MLSVGTYLLAMAIAAAPVEGMPRVEYSPMPAGGECNSGELPECAREPLAEDLHSLSLATPSCNDGSSSECPLLPRAENARPSVYGEVLCDADDSRECLAPSVVNDRPIAAAILSCENPYLTTMIGSCDLPQEPEPGRRSHVPTLRNGAATGVALLSTAHGGHVVIVSPLPTADGALIASPGRLQVFIPPVSALLVALPSPALAPPPPRLDRPPRV